MANSADSSILQIGEFTMRPMGADDVDAIATLWADPGITRFLPSRGVPIPREATEKVVASFVEHWQQRGYGVWTIVKNNSEVIGYCGLRYLDQLGEVELLYGLAKVYWGQGITSQASQAAITYGFNTTSLDKIIALALPENQASRRVMEKAGLRYVKQIQIFNLDAVYYSIERQNIQQC